MTVALAFHFEDNVASIQSGRDVDMLVWRSMAYSFSIDSYMCIDCTECGIRFEDEQNGYSMIFLYEV